MVSDMAMTPPTRRPAVRTRIMDFLEQAFNAETDLGGEPGLQWERVTRGPITASMRSLKTVLSLRTGPETSVELSVAEQKTLAIILEFEVRAYMGEEPDVFVTEVMSDVLKTLYAHSQAGGLCLHIKPSRSEVDVQAGEARSVGGIVFATVQYRHALGDPCRLVGE